MNVELNPHSQLASACRASCPAGRDCRDCPLAKLRVQVSDPDGTFDALGAADVIRPLVRVENLNPAAAPGAGRRVA